MVQKDISCPTCRRVSTVTDMELVKEGLDGEAMSTETKVGEAAITVHGSYGTKVGLATFDGNLGRKAPHQKFTKGSW